MNRLALAGLLLLTLSACGGASPEEPASPWGRLPDVPLATGGPFAGMTNGALVVAGGAYFPDEPGYEGGTKVWVDSVYVLPEGADAWQAAEPLEAPRAYGASVTTEGGIILIGGSDAEEHTDEVVRLRWTGDRLERTPLPSLPKPVAMTGAAMLDSAVYVAGGQATPTSTEAMQNFWALDLRDPERGWQVLEAWPGPGRILAPVAATEEAVYVVSGAALMPDSAGQATRRFLTDAYRYRPEAGWERVADVPRAVVAAPAAGVDGRLLVFGGDDGELFFRQAELKGDHPGFPKSVLAFDPAAGAWTSLPGEMPEALVTTNAVPTGGGVVIPTGEVRPSHRLPSVMRYQALERAGAAVRGFGGLDYAVLALYLALLVGMGFYFSRREGTTDDFFLAGGRIPWWAAGLSIFGTQLSALTFMGIPAKAFAEDWVFLLVNLGILLVAPLVIYFYLPFYRRLRVTTAYEYLERRFNLPVRWFASVTFILFQLGRMGIVVALPSIALATVTGFSVYACILFMGVLATLYTVLGGIEAVIWTDVLQVFVLVGGAVLSFGIILGSLEGGFGELVAVAQADDKFHMVNWTWDATTTALWVVIVGNVFGALVPYTTDQTVIQRYLTTKDEASARQAIWTNAALTVPATLLFFGVGTALFVFYQTHPGRLSPGFASGEMAGDAIFPFFIAGELPAGVAGLVIAGLFAAAMSSLDSSMNSIATALVTDFWRRLRPQMPDRAALRLAKVLTLVLGAVGTLTALLIATFDVESLWELFLQVLGLFGGSLAGLFILGIFTRKANGRGALVGAVLSVLVLVGVWQLTDVHFFLYATVGIAACVGIGYLASLVLPDQARDLAGLTIYTQRKAEPEEAVRV